MFTEVEACPIDLPHSTLLDGECGVSKEATIKHMEGCPWWIRNLNPVGD